MENSVSISAEPQAAIALSKAVATLPGLSVLLGCPIKRKASRYQGDAEVVLGWGRKPSTEAAEAFAKRHSLPLWRIEDGFLRSLHCGDIDPSYSLVVDDIGIYYDASAPSRLELQITEPLSPGELTRAKNLISLWRRERVSKYNHSRSSSLLPETRFVLAVDQTAGDISIKTGSANATSFQQMLTAALEENPDCTVLLKIHPEVFSGRKKGHFDVGALSKNPRISVISEDVHPVDLLEKAEAIYVVTSQLGFEGLIWGKRVRTFGMPFYAGWGLTHDTLSPPKRRSNATLESLVFAALVRYPRFLHPETETRCEVESLIEWLGHQRRMRERFPKTVYAHGFSMWKRPTVEICFGGSNVEFLTSIDEAPAGSTLAVWGSRTAGEIRRNPEIKCLQIEDGFLRSIGLGAELISPLSWVVDRRGIYYDSRTPSDLEVILQNTPFSPELLARGCRLIELITKHGLTKYNVGQEAWHRPEGKKHIILVPGQVESDASIQFGAPGVSTNLGLLQSIRAQYPDAYLVYKPHPDVMAGLRPKGSGEESAADYCDEVISNVSMDALFKEVDEVHVLTSLTGFEALLRGLPVTCHGQPFYSGWGLTRDLLPLPRRTRRLTLEELVVGALILYPTYFSRTTKTFTTPERALDELVIWRKQKPLEIPIWRKILRVFLRRKGGGRR